MVCSRHVGLFPATLIAPHASNTSAVQAVVRQWTFTAHPKPKFELDIDKWMVWQNRDMSRMKKVHGMILGKEYIFNQAIPDIWKKLYVSAHLAGCFSTRRCAPRSILFVPRRLVGTRGNKDASRLQRGLALPLAPSPSLLRVRGIMCIFLSWI